MAIIMPWPLAQARTWGSWTEPPACAMNLTPNLAATSMLSGKGKNASDANATPSSFFMSAARSDAPSSGGAFPDAKSLSKAAFSWGAYLRAPTLSRDFFGPCSRRQTAVAARFRHRRGAIVAKTPSARPRVRVEATLEERDARVDALLALEALGEGQVEDGRRLAQPPRRDLLRRELDAVDARLLARADADDLAAHREADGVGLRVFGRNRRQHEVALRVAGHGPARDRVHRDVGLGALARVARLGEADAVDLAVLERRRRVRRVDLDAHELAALLGGEDLQRVGVEARRDDAVRDLALEHERGRGVDDVRERHEVAKGAERVRLARADVPAGVPLVSMST